MTSDMHLHFKVAIPDDAAQIAQLVQIAFRYEDVKWTGPDVELNRRFTMTTEEALATINNPNAAFLMAITDDDTIVGAMIAIKKTEELARLAKLAVDPTFQTRGIGRFILEQTEEYVLKTWCVERIGLNALSTRGSLIKWYEKRGYTKTGEKSELPAWALRNMGLARAIHFVEMEKQVREAEVVGKI
jgi:ribosomal protein S18 acetylase RimI-like enzyme